MAADNLHYFNPAWVTNTDQKRSADVCVYGGNAAGVSAAVTVARRGQSVLLLHPGKHLGGMTSGGLGWTDFGSKDVLGGLSRQFYRELGEHYNVDEEWLFEPGAAETVLNRWVEDHDIELHLCQYIEDVTVDDRRITELSCLGGLRCQAQYFIDATYEGDLMALAGVEYTVGREHSSTYGESLNGAQVRACHQFSHPVDPYIEPGRPESGLLPHIESQDMRQHQGEGDQRVQAYCFRVCMTNDPALRVAWPKPADFNDQEYELARRWFAGDKDAYNEQLRNPGGIPYKFDVLRPKTPGGFNKTDTNNHGPISSDYIGMSWAWAEASHEAREAIFQQHVSYQQGYYWVMANDPAIPERYRTAYQQWGLARDEFTDTRHWPHQLYVREARRMVGDYVVTQHDCEGKRCASDGVGMGSYGMDSHNCTRFVELADDGARVVNEGDVQVPASPYPISYRSIVPKRGDCENLLVPVCLSASHIAYGSARMEPVFMVLGESAATAATLCLNNRCPVQELPYDELHSALTAADQVLARPEEASL